MVYSASPSHIELISTTVAKLRRFCQENILPNWRYLAEDLPADQVKSTCLSGWTPVQLNAKEHVTWMAGRKVLWLAQKYVVPEALEGYFLKGLSLRLALTWWANSVEVYVNGKLVAEGDLFDCSPRVLLSKAVTPKDEFFVALRLLSPEHCDGALMRSLLIYEATGDRHPDPGFVAEELALVQLYLQKYAPQQLNSLAAEIEKINWPEPHKNPQEQKQEFEKILFDLRQSLIKFKVPALNAKIYLLGHAHLDMAWLWRVSETWQAAQNTFESVLKLQQDFPELIFCHSTPALYAWIEKHRPDLFQSIQQKVTQGRWEVVGAFWVEPDLNLIAGESIARQLLYGQRYILEKFGQLSTVEWVPDSFGFCATLPQFLHQAGIKYFVTQKLRWNDTTEFPYGAFWWRSPDGSQVLGFMSAPIGEGIEPLKMANYAIEWQTQTGFADCLWLVGVGDHGGGPTQDMLEVARRFLESPFFPTLEFTTAQKYLQQLLPANSESAFSKRRRGPVACRMALERVCTSLPTWNDELYLEFHRGCYTTHADQKRWNRRCEHLLYQAELFASIATIRTSIPYPKAQLATAWKKLLFNQFHDILPGSSIAEVYEDALQDWQEVAKTGTEILQQSLRAIASQIHLPQPPQPDSFPVFVFNSLNWQRSEVVAVPLPSQQIHQQWQIHDACGHKIVSQLSQANLLFLASDIPPVGYRLFWLSAALPSEGHTYPHYDATNYSVLKQEHFSPENLTLENEFLQVKIDEKTGNLSSIFDKVNNREVLDGGGGNQLQAFRDSGQYWDAWNIDPNYAQHPLPPARLKSLQWLENGPVQSRLRVIRQVGNSEFSCDYILQSASPILKIATIVDWQESQVLVKAAFSLNLEADFATYEIPCGAICRPTKPQTPAEQAKWEVPALRWADLSANKQGDAYGVSLLNDCKYGYDSQSNQLRLTLLRSPNWPDPQADRGWHEFTYALYPHAGDWKSAQTVRRGYELNIPLQVVVLSKSQSPPPEPKVNLDRLSFLDLGAANLILMALKQAEEDQQRWIVRCYECHGETAQMDLQGDLKLTVENATDLLERPACQSGSFAEKVTLRPWQIASFQLQAG